MSSVNSHLDRSFSQHTSFTMSHFMVLTIFLFLTMLVWTSPCNAADIGNEKGKANKYSSNCGECHVDIYESWKLSRHNQSLNNAYFRLAESEFRRQTDVYRLPLGKDFCRTCHNPALSKSESSNVSEGVRCAFCHSIKVVALGRRPSPFVLDDSDVRYGPRAQVRNSSHPTLQSDLFGQSLLCAGCHEWKTDSGLAILSTYSEWKESGLEKQGIHCQSCHMSEVKGNAVDPKLMKDKYGKINMHKFSGGHTASMLHDAVKVDIDEVIRTGGNVQIRLSVQNSNTGHYFPTGMPTRRVEVAVNAKWGNGTEEEKKQVMQRKFADDDDQPISGAYEIFQRATKLVSDTRLRPNEKREFSFSFDGSPSDSCELEIRLVYFDDPLPGMKKPHRSVFYHTKRKR